MNAKITILLCLTLLSMLANAMVYTTVAIPATNNIQTELYSTFPTGTFTANNYLATPFSIASAPGKCGPSGASPCNYYDGFGFSGSGMSITMNVSVASPTHVYTLMNAYKPAAGQQLATIKFVGSGGASVTFPIVGGLTIRDYRESIYAGTLSNGTTGVQAMNAFACNDPANCISVAGGVDNLVADEQDFSLGSAFAGQTLTQIIITDTYNGSSPILMGITIGTGAPPSPNLLTNGDFELNAVAGGTGVDINSGSAAIPGWTIIGTASSTVALVNGALTGYGLTFPAQSGYQWLDLAGTYVAPGGTRSITQTVPTVAGMSYLLTFWVGNVYDPTGPFGTTSTVAVKINGAASGSFTNSAQTTALSWQQFSVTFTGTGNSTAIEFDNMDPTGDDSNGLDNVILQQMGAPSLNTVISAGAFGGFTSVAPGSWIEIYGSGLASDARSWGSADFSGNNAPTSLDGTKVTIGGKSAFIDYISPSQVNALVTSDTPTGAQQLTVTNSIGTSSTYNVTVNALEPGFLAPASFNIGGTQYAAALFTDGVIYVLPVGAIPGVASRPAKPGDTIILYGVGFGPVTPAIPAGQIVQQANSLASAFQMAIGGVPVTPQYAGLAPNFVGLYQFNIVVPNVPTGTAPLTFTLGGTPGTQTLNLAIGN